MVFAKLLFAFNWQRHSPIIQLGLYFKKMMNK